MPDWRIHSPRNPDWQCHLADCDEAHANSVMAALRDDPTCPDYLELENLTPEPEVDDTPRCPVDGAYQGACGGCKDGMPGHAQPEPEPVAEPETEPRKRRFSWRRK